MCLCICIDESYRRKGIAEASLNQLLLSYKDNIEKIEVYIDESNMPSIQLFTKIGFVDISHEDGAIKMEKLLNT